MTLPHDLILDHHLTANQQLDVLKGVNENKNHVPMTLTAMYVLRKHFPEAAAHINPCIDRYVNDMIPELNRRAVPGFGSPQDLSKSIDHFNFHRSTQHGANKTAFARFFAVELNSGKYQQHQRKGQKLLQAYLEKSIPFFFTAAFHSMLRLAFAIESNNSMEVAMSLAFMFGCKENEFVVPDVGSTRCEPTTQLVKHSQKQSPTLGDEKTNEKKNILNELVPKVLSPTTASPTSPHRSGASSWSAGKKERRKEKRKSKSNGNSDSRSGLEGESKNVGDSFSSSKSLIKNDAEGSEMMMMMMSPFKRCRKELHMDDNEDDFLIHQQHPVADSVLCVMRNKTIQQLDPIAIAGNGSIGGWQGAIGNHPSFHALIPQLRLKDLPELQLQVLQAFEKRHDFTVMHAFNSYAALLTIVEFLRKPSDDGIIVPEGVVERLITGYWATTLATLTAIANIDKFRQTKQHTKIDDVSVVEVGAEDDAEQQQKKLKQQPKGILPEVLQRGVVTFIEEEHLETWTDVVKFCFSTLASSPSHRQLGSTQFEHMVKTLYACWISYRERPEFCLRFRALALREFACPSPFT